MPMCVTKASVTKVRVTLLQELHSIDPFENAAPALASMAYFFVCFGYTCIPLHRPAVPGDALELVPILLLQPCHS